MLVLVALVIGDEHGGNRSSSSPYIKVPFLPRVSPPLSVSILGAEAFNFSEDSVR